jgi:hypothetical protein
MPQDLKVINANHRVLEQFRLHGRDGERFRALALKLKAVYAARLGDNTEDVGVSPQECPELLAELDRMDKDPGGQTLRTAIAGIKRLAQAAITHDAPLIGVAE